MVNITNGSFLGKVDLNVGAEKISFLSKFVTQKVLEYLSNKGINFSLRFVNLVIVFFALLIIYLGMKISKPIIKILIVILGILIIAGSIVPSW